MTNLGQQRTILKTCDTLRNMSESCRRNTMLKIKSLEHIAIAVRDTDAEAEWYHDVLGFSIVYKAPTPPRNYFIRDPAGRSMIEILPLKNPQDLNHFETSPAHLHVAFDVDDFDGVKAALEAKGVTVEEPSSTPSGTKLAFFRDPEGIPLQLVYRPQPF
jgi:catechol 2,3-dioxygenase-like lactoylglutathione lyase family enzyme